MPEDFPRPEEPFRLFFRAALLEWSRQHPRPMPWKGEKDPYRIWLSEIILQQTRVEQGLPYYEKFVRHYPTVQQLADAPEDQVLKDWEGLGYYSRARNLHAAARYVAHHLNGKFPDTYEAIRLLKGVGPYTAAAIASFGFGLPHAVLDGNVYRVLARIFGIDTPIDTPKAQKQFATLAGAMLDPDAPAAYNQAMMDFGALCCTPSQPACRECPFRDDCVARQQNRVNELPKKQKGLTRKKRTFHYLVIRHQEHWFVRKRMGKDIWKGLWEFPFSENDVPEVLLSFEPKSVSAPVRQLLTHQEITAIFYELEFPDALPTEIQQCPLLEDCRLVTLSELKKNIAFPKVIDCFLQSKVLTLN
ncbi:MAG: A/G-specific adenine glycosylase [Saprospiraceae bacterium]|nr:A/G-specific adenine glycosylase [Saprospiraceae bacterium]